MRIVVNDYLGQAPQVQLSRALAARGHDVLHLYSADAQTPKADLTPQPDDPSTFAIKGLTLARRPVESFIAKRLQEAKFGRKLAAEVIAFHPDVVIACNNPLDVQRPLQAACRRAGVLFVYWMYDFIAAKLDDQINHRGALMNLVCGSYYHALERKLLHRSDAIVPVAHDMLGVLAESWDVYERQSMVVPNWAPLDQLKPGVKSNAWAQGLGLTEKKIVLYSGSLGPAEEPTLLVDLAKRLSKAPEIELVVVSEGAGAELVDRQARELGQKNIRVLPFQPYDIYGDVLATADVLVATIAEHAGVVSMPSKVSSYLCAGRPIVLSAPMYNLAANLIRESKAGEVVGPGNGAAMAAAVLKFLTDEKLWQETALHARRYAEQTFDISKISGQFERLFERLHSGPARSRTPESLAGV